MKQFVRTQCRKRLTALDSAIRTLRKAPQNIEALHGVRVSVRRLQQCLRLFKAFLPKKPVRKLRRRLRNLMDACGAVRDWDIALQTLTQAKLLNREWRARCKAERLLQQVRLTSHLDRWRGSRSAAHWKAKLPVSQGNWDHEALELAIRDWFDAGDSAQQGDTAALHRFRLLGKRLRYTLEVLEPLLNPPVAPALQTLRRVQDRLGSINDCAATQRLFPEVAEGLRSELGRRTSMYRTAWSTIRKQRTRWRFTFCDTAKPNRASSAKTTKNAH